ncbi:DNA cytosine methyltransferase [Methylobacterium organophilum]|uniref:DNA cytosine methyltransferase n=1 Tax=Methylobacterium TaxID=407 RepID=UPI0019D30310|nr:DNA cytosine methyltransferase [Methylobacterium organophilum]MBN6819582.1 DNA cytosine methyltransferase [Methylobacterium organophilum]
MSSPLVLSLFPGIGLLDMAFEEAGFCVVRGPDLLWGGDVHRFHPPAGRFDGVIGGPPCQAFSRLRHIVEANGYQTAPNLIPEYERIVAAAAPAWFLMENVPAAPEPSVPGYKVRDSIIADHWVGGVTGRERRFSFGTALGQRLEIETLALHVAEPEPAALASKGTAIVVALGGSGKPKRSATSALNTCRRNEGVVAEHLRKQGLPADFLDNCPLTVTGKIKVLGNGVPLAMGRAVAAAVCRAIGFEPGREVAA